MKMNIAVGIGPTRHTHKEALCADQTRDFEHRQSSYARNGNHRACDSLFRRCHAPIRLSRPARSNHHRDMQRPIDDDGILFGWQALHQPSHRQLHGNRLPDPRLGRTPHQRCCESNCGCDVLEREYLHNAGDVGGSWAERRLDIAILVQLDELILVVPPRGRLARRT